MKWKARSQTVAAIVALYTIAVLNLAFWRFVWEKVEITGLETFLFVLTIPIIFFLILFAFFNLLLWPYVGKFALASLLILSSAANYFMYNLNILIDSEMLRNVFETVPREAAEMITWGGILWVLLSGVIPAALLMLTRIHYHPWWREISRRAVSVAVCLVLAAGLGLLYFKDYSTTARNNKSVGKMINPVNFLASTARYLKKKSMAFAGFTVIDPSPLHVPYEDASRTVIVMVVGETARAMNFSLFGYGRPTNPELAKEDVICFKDVTSSGTATAFSLPCMFSHLPREKFNIDTAAITENLLDVVQKAGYEVVWLENNMGSKGVSDRVTTIDMHAVGNPKYRNGDNFVDEVLLDGLEERIRASKKDMFIVLHTLDSHGPSYYRRYPAAFRVFTPTCDTAEIQSRPVEEIVNTYDNTILYTDHVLAGVINILKRFPQLEAGMLYVSDHGESLGENNLFLHGFPYAFAPKEQTHIPMILWMSETMKREDHVDYEKLRAAAETLHLSHDNIFHSMLGLVEIDSALYNPSLDFFTNYRTKALPFQEVAAQ